MESFPLLMATLLTTKARQGAPREPFQTVSTQKTLSVVVKYLDPALKRRMGYPPSGTERHEAHE
jgi:hypothetical protein